MLVKGTRKVTEAVEVNVQEVLDKLYYSCMRSVYKGKGEYINSKGVWESWDDTGHGSGITTTYEPATQEQLDLDRALRYIINFTEKHNIL